MSAPDIRLNHTIYINNLNEKIKKDGVYLPASVYFYIPLSFCYKYIICAFFTSLFLDYYRT